MKDYDQCELEVLAAVGELLVSKLKGRDDLAYAIFDALLAQFQGRYPHHKILTDILLGNAELRVDMKSRHEGDLPPFSELPDKF
jgi:hypothetical protein